MNIASILTAATNTASYIKGHPATKDGGLSTILVAGLYAAGAAGVAIPGWAPVAAAIVGYVGWKLLPAKTQADIMEDEEKFVEAVDEVPQTYSAPTDFPAAQPQVATINNLNPS